MDSRIYAERAVMLLPKGRTPYQALIWQYKSTILPARLDK